MIPGVTLATSVLNVVYRDDPRYEERRLGPNDEVYRGSDGRYYCKRSDGTTGLVIGAVGGARLDQLDGASFFRLVVLQLKGNEDRASIRESCDVLLGLDRGEGDRLR